MTVAVEGQRRGISDAFRAHAERLARMMQLSLDLRVVRDEAEVEVAVLKGALASAEVKLAVARRAVSENRELSAPVSELLLRWMEQDANGGAE